MNTVLENAIIDKLHGLDEQHQAEVLDFVEYLTAKLNSIRQFPGQIIDPQRDLSPFIGVKTFTEDGIAYQRCIRDNEWS